MKKTINLSIAGLVCLLLLGTNALQAQDWSKDQKAVWNVIEKGWEAYTNGDSKTAFEGIHDNYLGWNSEDPLPTSKEKWMKEYDRWNEYVTFDYYDLQPARIVVTGNNAVAFYYFNYSSTYSKDDMKKNYDVEGRNVEFLVKEDGEWKLLGDMTYLEDDDD